MNLLGTKIKSIGIPESSLIFLSWDNVGSVFPFSQLTLGIYFHLWYILKRHCGSVSITLQLWLVWGDSDHSFSSITVNQFVNASTFLFTWLHSRILCGRQQCSKYLSGGINLCQCTLLELIFPSTNMIAASFLQLIKK